MTIEQLILKYPIGSKVILTDDDKTDESHEVIGYKYLNQHLYLILNDVDMVLVERVSENDNSRSY